MENFVDFLLHHYREIVLGIIVLLEVSILVFKRLKIKVTLPNGSMNQLVLLVSSAEEIFGSGHGKEKLNYVIQRYCEDNSISYLSPYLKEYLEMLVEMILSTPQKKGDCDEKVK